MTESGWVALMPSRLGELRAAAEGLERTGVPLVGWRDGGPYPVGYTDDLGLFYFVPQLARLLGIPVESAADLFLGGSLLVGLVVGVAAVWIRFRRLKTRLWVTGVAVALAALAFGIGGVYILNTALALAFFPLLLLADRRASARQGLAILVALGVAAGAAHLVRSHAGTPLLLLALVLIGSRRSLPVRRRAAAVAALLVALLTPPLLFDRTVDARDAFLVHQVENYEPPPAGHPFWHTAFIGFGFLSNDLGIEYRDEAAVARVEAIAPDAAYVSAEYEAALRGEVFRLVVEHPWFVVRTLAAKAGIVFGYLILFGNVGLFLAFVHPPPPRILLAVGAALTFAAIPGFVAIPAAPYLSSFTTIAGVFGAWLVGRRLEDYQPAGSVPATPLTITFGEDPGHYPPEGNAMEDRKSAEDRSQLLTRYHETHGSYVDGPPAAKSEWFRRRLAEVYSQHLPPADADPKVLELACGSGYLLAALRDRGYGDLTGVDLSAADVRAARTRVPEAEVLEEDVTRFLEAAQERFDVVIAKALLEHVPKSEVIPLLRAIRDTLAPGGVALIEVPNMDWMLAGHERFMDFTHEVGFTRESLGQVLRTLYDDVTVVPVPPTELRGPAYRVVRRLVWPLARWAVRSFLKLAGGDGEHTLWEYRSILGVARKPVG